MTLATLQTKLTAALKDYISSKGHVSSGKLLKSIKFKCKMVKSSLDIRLLTLEYIQYLEDGEFLNKFLNTDIASELIEEFYVDYLNDNLI